MLQAVPPGTSPVRQGDALAEVSRLGRAFFSGGTAADHHQVVLCSFRVTIRAMIVEQMRVPGRAQVASIAMAETMAKAMTARRSQTGAERAGNAHTDVAAGERPTP